nr:uncharacterized protein LOC127310167 [Lolium perenne]
MSLYFWRAEIAERANGFHRYTRRNPTKFARIQPNSGELVTGRGDLAATSAGAGAGACEAEQVQHGQSRGEAGTRRRWRSQGRSGTGRHGRGQRRGSAARTQPGQGRRGAGGSEGGTGRAGAGAGRHSTAREGPWRSWDVAAQPGGGGAAMEEPGEARAGLEHGRSWAAWAGTRPMLPDACVWSVRDALRHAKQTNEQSSAVDAICEPVG